MKLLVFSKRTPRLSCECQVSSWMSGAAFTILGLLIHYKLSHCSVVYSPAFIFGDLLHHLGDSLHPSYVGSPFSWISSISLSWFTLIFFFVGEVSFSSFFRKGKWKLIFKDLIWQKMHVRTPCMSENILTSH